MSNHVMDLEKLCHPDSHLQGDKVVKLLDGAERVCL